MIFISRACERAYLKAFDAATFHYHTPSVFDAATFSVCSTRIIQTAHHIAPTNFVVGKDIYAESNVNISMIMMILTKQEQKYEGTKAERESCANAPIRTHCLFVCLWIMCLDVVIFVIFI